MVFQVEVVVFNLYNTGTAIEIVVKLELNHGSQLALFSAYVMPMRLFFSFFLCHFAVSSLRVFSIALTERKRSEWLQKKQEKKNIYHSSQLRRKKETSEVRTLSMFHRTLLTRINLQKRNDSSQSNEIILRLQ
jgi:hypothetical protein